MRDCRDCHAAACGGQLAMTGGMICGRACLPCHCEEQSDEAIVERMNSDWLDLYEGL